MEYGDIIMAQCNTHVAKQNASEEAGWSHKDFGREQRFSETPRYVCAGRRSRAGSGVVMKLLLCVLM